MPGGGKLYAYQNDRPILVKDQFCDKVEVNWQKPKARFKEAGNLLCFDAAWELDLLSTNAFRRPAEVAVVEMWLMVESRTWQRSQAMWLQTELEHLRTTQSGFN